MLQLAALIDKLNSEVDAACDVTNLMGADPIDNRVHRFVFSEEELLAPTSDHEFIENVFLCVLHRAVDAGALNWYKESLSTGHKTRSSILSDVFSSDEAQRVGIGIIERSDATKLVLAIARETAESTKTATILMNEVNLMKARLTAIPRAQTSFLKSIYRIVEDMRPVEQ